MKTSNNIFDIEGLHRRQEELKDFYSLIYDTLLHSEKYIKHERKTMRYKIEHQTHQYGHNRTHEGRKEKNNREEYNKLQISKYQSCKNQKCNINIFKYQNSNINDRLKKYNTKDLIYFETFSNIEQAIAREKQLKNWHKEWKLNLIKTISTFKNLKLLI